MEKSTKLCSFDTSSSATGWCIYINGEYQKSGVFDLNEFKDTSEERLKYMCTLILNFLDKEKPDLVVAEMTVVSRNAAGQRLLTMILGVVYCWCIQNDVYFEMLRPTEWRKLISDEKKGRKNKELKAWSKAKVKELFGIDVGDDESDAVLVGMALINKYKNIEGEI